MFQNERKVYLMMCLAYQWCWSKDWDLACVLCLQYSMWTLQWLIAFVFLQYAGVLGGNVFLQHKWHIFHSHLSVLVSFIFWKFWSIQSNGLACHEHIHADATEVTKLSSLFTSVQDPAVSFDSFTLPLLVTCLYNAGLKGLLGKTSGPQIGLPQTFSEVRWFF